MPTNFDSAASRLRSWQAAASDRSNALSEPRARRVEGRSAETKPSCNHIPMTEITVTLPDGSSRRVPAGHHAGDVAAADLAGLAQGGARGGRRRPAGRSRRIRSSRTRTVRDRHRPRAPRRWRSTGTARRTCWRPRSRSLFPGRAVRHRSGDRRRLLLRLRRRSAVRAGGPRGDREEDEGAGGAGPALRAADVAARRGAAVLRREAASRSRCS